MLPEYTAVRELVPTGSVLVVRLATELTTVAEPSDAVPLKKVTVPGVVEKTPPTVAVRVTDPPCTIWIADGVNVVVVG